MCTYRLQQCHCALANTFFARAEPRIYIRHLWRHTLAHMSAAMFVRPKLIPSLLLGYNAQHYQRETVSAELAGGKYCASVSSWTQTLLYFTHSSKHT